MPEMAEVFRYLLGSWRMMMGRSDGLKLLDISADGFWNSFMAIAIALPALAAGWVSIADAVLTDPVSFGSRLGIMLKLATVDIGSWVLPLVVFTAAARRAGIADRVAHYVISSNWGSALIAWMMLPPTLLRMIIPAAADFASAVSVGLFVISLVLTWRLTNSALGKGAGVATVVFGAMFVISLLVLYLLQSALGLGSLDPASG
jgi:hypothetical protein